MTTTTVGLHMRTPTNEQNWTPPLPTQPRTLQTQQRRLRHLRPMDRPGPQMATPDELLRRPHHTHLPRRQQPGPAPSKPSTVQPTALQRQEATATDQSRPQLVTGPGAVPRSRYGQHSRHCCPYFFTGFSTERFPPSEGG